MTNFNKQKSTLFCRMLFLLTLMLVGSNVSWAQTSYGKGTVNAAPTHATDWQTMAYVEGGFRAWYSGTSSSEFTLGGKQINDQWFVKLSDTGFIRIRVPKGAVVAGDILRVETIDIYQNGDQQNLGFKVEGSNSTVTLKETDNALHTLDYTLKAGDIQKEDDSNDYIQINRNGNSGCGYHSVEILRNILDASTFKVWSDINGNTSTGTATCATLGSSVDAGGTVFGDGSVGYLNYVNVKGGSGAIMPDAKCLIIEGNAGVQVRILFNRVAHEGSLQEQTVTIPSSGKLFFDISSYDTFHLNAIKIPYNGSTGNVVNSIKISNSLQTYTVNVNRAGLPTGCDAYFTIGSDETHYTTAQTVTEGTQVTYTMSSSDPHYTPSGWRTKAWEEPDYGWMGYSASFTTTLRSEAAGTETNEQRLYGNLNPTPEFNKFFFVKAVAETGGTATVTDASGHNTSERYDNTTGELTFTATPSAGYAFDGWYNTAGTKVGTTASWNSGTYGSKNSDVDLVYTAKFKVVSKKITPKPTCGGKDLDQTKLEAGANATLSINDGKGTVTIGGTPGYVSFFFAEGYKLTELYEWTVGCQDDAEKINVDYVAFCKDGQIIKRASDNKEMIFNYNAPHRVLETEYKAVLTSVDEIRIGFKANTTTTIRNFNIHIKHDLASKKPILVSPTATEMSIFTDETLQLRISDTHGFWREFTDNTYTTPKFDHIGHDSNGQAEWKPSYDISNLPVGHYYFGIKDEGDCAIGNHHETELVTVHVEVKQAIYSINVNGTTRHYDVYAPEGISGNVGVVISLHGASNDYDNGRVEFDEIAETEKNIEGKKFVVVYPRGLMRQLRGTERGWETYTENNTEDVDFFKAIVNNLNQEFSGQFSVDMNRVYLAGFSNGGMMAYKAAHQAGDFFKAFASVGGYPVNESHLFHAGKQPTPFIHIQGKADGIFPNSTYPLDVIAHNMVYRNGAKFNPWKDDAYEKQDGEMITSPKDGENNDIIEKDCHAALPGGAAFYMYKVAGMGHTWKYDWDNDTNHTDDVAATIWKFFNKEGIVNAVDPTLKFRFDDSDFWGQASGVGFDNVNSGTSVLSYGGRTKTDNAGATYDKDDNNKNLYHTLQFDGGTFGAPHYMKLQVYTELVQTEDPNQYFVVELTKTGDSKPVFRKRYQAGRGEKPLYINFTADSYFNEYKLTITKSSSDLVVTVKGVEFHSGKCQDVGKEENPVFFQDVASVLMGMNPIYQPVYDQSFDEIAKEYLPIADIPVHEENVAINNRILADDLHYTNGTTTTYLRNVGSGVLPSTLVESWDGSGKATVTKNQIFNLAHSSKTGEDLDHKIKNAFIAIPVDMTYTVDKTKGINISQHGKADMPAYIAGDKDDFPDHGMIAFKVQGTLDFTVLAVNDIEYNPASVADESRRKLRVYYVNDQMNGKPAELQNWDFYGERSEQHHTNLNALEMNIRLPQLGKDGTCTVFISYEGTKYEAEAADDKVWIKGIVIKRPDLKVTIGRTDNLYTDKYYDDSSKKESDREHNTFLTPYGENKPYIWSFKDAGFKNTNSVDLNLKKINEKDGRTYVCGKYVNPETSAQTQLIDHLLVYSDINSTDNNDKVQFDGRVAGQEHIEFRNASKYNIPDGNLSARNVFDPIQANGLKVNVTGSGWFKIRCSAPNGPVNMKVYSSTNYGAAYINLLREFRVEKTASETDWQEYTVYLKGHINRIAEKEKPADQRRAQEGFWDGDPANAWDEQENAEEVLRMSLFVVYDEIAGETYPDEDGNHPQLNIHELSWLNEKPADYVFQREENPKFLTEWQEIKRGGNTVLWWKAANDDDEQYPVLKENGNNAYNRLGQTTTSIAGGKGEKSPEDYVSKTATWADGTSYDAYWDIAAATTTNAHTEAGYGKTGVRDAASEYKYKNGSNTEFDLPVSGSFLRICAMQNTYVIAHVLPGNLSAKIYVLDETGSPIPTSAGDAADKKRLGYIAAMSNVTNSGAENMTNDGTVRIELAINAGKEYFICADGAPVSLARLEVKDDQYNPTKNSTLELVDNADNTSAIGTPYSNEQFYCDANLKRKPESGKWFSLVLPFSMNEKKFEQVFGVGSKCVHFTDVDKETNTIKLTHHYYNMIVAGRPVFVYATNTFSAEKINFNDVTLQAKEVKTTTTDSGFEFFASYKNETMKKNDLYMNKANAINYLNVASATYPGMRSFVKNNCNWDFSTGVTTSMGAKALFLNFNDEGVEDATDIEALVSSEFGQNAIVVNKSTKVYDLNGRVVANGTDLSNLPSGVYIVNGKKYVK